MSDDFGTVTVELSKKSKDICRNLVKALEETGLKFQSLGVELAILKERIANLEEREAKRNESV